MKKYGPCSWIIRGSEVSYGFHHMLLETAQKSHASKWSILSLFSKSNRTLQNKFFVSFRCSNMYVLPMKKWSLKNIVWFHENPRFFVFYNEKWWWTGPQGKLLNVFVFSLGKKKELVSRRADFFDFFYMRTNKIRHFCGLGPIHLYGRGCKTFNLLKPPCLSVHSSVHS